MSGEGLEISAVFSALVLAASSAACLSAFCCFKILSTALKVSTTLHIYILADAPLYPRRFRALRSVDSMVMNNKASLTFGASNSKRHKEIATLIGDTVIF